MVMLSHRSGETEDTFIADFVVGLWTGQLCGIWSDVGGGVGVMVSYRSGETEDTFIADLVVGLCTGQVCGIWGDVGGGVGWGRVGVVERCLLIFPF